MRLKSFIGCTWVCVYAGGFFFFKQKTAYEMLRSLVGSEMCIRDSHRPVTSYHQHSGGKKAGDLLAEIGRGKNVALVSEAGMPGISDPGHELIAACIAAGIQVIPIPGACALITLLPVSGLNTSAFVFQGFPPRKPGERARFFEGLRQETRTLLFYESPNRVRATLEAMLDAWGDRPVALGRELTKLHEDCLLYTSPSPRDS